MYMKMINIDLQPSKLQVADKTFMGWKLEAQTLR